MPSGKLTDYGLSYMLTDYGLSYRPKKINKVTLDLNKLMDKMNLTDIYWIFHLIAAKYTFFLSVQTAYIFQDRSCIRPQSKWKQIKWDWN